MIINGVFIDNKLIHYICSKCNCIYYLRYEDSTLCSSCRMPIHKELAKKLGTKIRFK